MITIVHQYQREKTRDGKLITTKEDIKMANAIMFESILLKVDELDGSLRHFYEQIKSLIEDREQEFTQREIRQDMNLSKSFVQRQIRRLLELEYIEEAGG
ncbi:MAG: MarR family transcriptional regulator [Bacteroidetes bacterium]|nr:MarR family transcriptional regulator [Bacteroidota bacterium]